MQPVRTPAFMTSCTFCLIYCTFPLAQLFWAGKGLFYKTCLPGRGWEQDTVQKSMLYSGKLDPYIETWMLTCLSIAITLIFNHGMGHFLKNNWVIIRLIQSHCENTNKKHNFRTYSVSLWWKFFCWMDVAFGIIFNSNNNNSCSSPVSA